MDANGLKLPKRGYSGARLELIKKAASLSLEEYTVPEIAIQLKISDSKVRRLLAASEGLPAISRAPEEPFFAKHCLIFSHLCRFVEKCSVSQVSAVAQPHAPGSAWLMQ
jgi:hypothetical protein